MKDDKILARVILEDLQEDDVYLGLIQRYKDAGFAEAQAIRIALLTGQELGGLFAVVKKIDYIYDRVRKRLARADRKKGDSYQAIARRYDFSEQTIRQLERDEQADKFQKRQQKLFG